MADISVLNSSANISGKTLLVAEVAATITALQTFDRDPSAPFGVTASSAVVTNLDADLLDGQHGSYYRTATNLNAGTVPTARLGSGSATASTYLRGDSSWAVVGASVTALTDLSHTSGILGIRTLRKSANETVNNSATLQSDDHITFAIAASEVWAFRIYLKITSNATADWKWAWSLPAAGVYFASHGARDGTADTQVAITTTASLAIVDTGVKIYEASGVLVNSVTAGTAVLQWAQDTATVVDTIIYANSYCILHQIA